MMQATYHDESRSLVKLLLDAVPLSIFGEKGSDLMTARCSGKELTGKPVRDLLSTVKTRLEEAVGLADVGPSDAEVGAAVAMALLADPATYQAIVGADVNEGIVTLSGTVDSFQARQKALSVARSQPGVKGVIDQLAVAQDEAQPNPTPRSGLHGGQALKRPLIV